ncbi:MAG: response regulator, partial [Candidatus Kapaibacterium sp.]
MLNLLSDYPKAETMDTPAKAKSSKILIVDDEPDVEGMFRLRFRRQIREGIYNFKFAGNGLEAVGQLEREPDIDLVVTDINMPEMDGLTLLNNLIGINPDLRAIIISAYGNMENIRSAMNGGAYDFLTKPLNFEDLESTMRKSLRLIHEARALREAKREALQRRRRANEQIRKALNKEKELNELKNRFISMISHQYRTPLTGILTATYIIEQ